MHYLDYNATAPIRPEARNVMQELQALPLNASSIHAFGRQAKTILHQARSALAEILGVFPAEITFTASGTEANNWLLRAFDSRKILVGATEHASILKTAHAITQPLIIPVQSSGIVDMEALEQKILTLGKNQFLVSIMLANNETGVIQPLKDIASLVHHYGGLLHTDAVQAFGRIAVDFTTLGCDFMTIAAHKMGGAVGAAALIAKNTISFPPFLIGGGQENRQRAGTENVPAIAAFAKAAQCIDLDSMREMGKWRGTMEAEIVAAGGEVIAKDSPRLPTTSCICMQGAAAETQLIYFDLNAIAVSSGSACSSGRIEPSHVLKAMQLSEGLITSALRVSTGWATSKTDIDAFLINWKKLKERRKYSR